MKLLTILARFGTEQYARAEAEIAERFAHQAPGVERTTVVVDNALPASLVDEQREPGERGGRVVRMVIGGDNSAYEFSAFDRALKYIGRDLTSYDLVHFATSAFNTLYVAYLDRFTEPLLQAVRGRNVCVGHIDCYNEPVELLQFRSQHWLRSCFFVMPPEEVQLLGSFVSIADPTPFFSGHADAPFRADAPLCATYRRYITDWLTGADIGQGVEWHSSFALSDATLSSFERKAHSILMEHLLAVRLRASGCRVVDVTWLSTQLRRGGRPVPWHTPWREQLAGRDRDALVLSRSSPTG